MRKTSVIPPPCPRSPHFLRNNSSPLPVPLRKLEKTIQWAHTHKHTSCRLAHATHIRPMSTRRGWGVHSLLMPAVSQMAHFVAHIRGVQRRQDYYAEWMHGYPYILHTHTQTREVIACRTSPIKTVWPGHAADCQQCWRASDFISEDVSCDARTDGQQNVIVEFSISLWWLLSV